MKHQIDKLDNKILKIISKNARTPFLEVARECNVSGAAIHQRVQKLIMMGVIKGSEFIIDTYKVGYKTCAFIGINVKNMDYLGKVVKALSEIPEIVECHYTTGHYSLFVKLYALDNRHLLKIVVEQINKIEGISQTETFQLSLDESFNRQISTFDNNIDIDSEKQD